jgi:hypothetical protein
MAPREPAGTLPKVSKQFRQGLQKVPKTINILPIPSKTFTRKPIVVKSLRLNWRMNAPRVFSCRRASRCKARNQHPSIVLPSIATLKSCEGASPREVRARSREVDRGVLRCGLENIMSTSAALVKKFFFRPRARPFPARTGGPLRMR